MLAILLLFSYLCGFFFVLGLFPVDWEKRPTLETFGIKPAAVKKRNQLRFIIQTIAKINRPICTGELKKRLVKDLATAHVNMTPEEFFLLKELAIMGCLYLSYPFVTADVLFFWVTMSFAFGYMLPEFWLKGKVKKVKNAIIKQLPDAIDLIGLCVNAGLDFMLALKWVVEKSPRNIMIEELNTVLQEINVGKTRREAIKDLANRFDLADLHTFARTLIQADKMGTSMTEALNILSEDMRIARYRRGEQMALKAPLKLLVPLMFFIFPVVGILVAGPILLDFIENSPFKGVGGM